MLKYLIVLLCCITSSCEINTEASENENKGLELKSFLTISDMARYCSPSCLVIEKYMQNGDSIIAITSSVEENHCGSFVLNWSFEDNVLDMHFIDTAKTVCDTIPAMIFKTDFMYSNLDSLRITNMVNQPLVDTIILFDDLQLEKNGGVTRK